MVEKHIKSISKVKVFCDNPHFGEPGDQLLVGYLRKDPISNNYIFSYRPEYLEHGCEYGPIDPINLPISSKNFPLGKKLKGVFADSAPDFWGRQILARTYGNYNLGELDYMALPDPARMGWLEFGHIGNNIPELDIIPDYLKIAKRIEEHQNISVKENEILRFYHGASIGGSRPKLSIQHEGALWVAKLPSIHDKWSNARVEMFSMRLAKECGIIVPDIKIIDNDVLLVKRFDRTPSGLRIGYLSAKTVLDLPDNMGGSYIDLALLMRRHGMVSMLEQLFRRMMFNAIIRNIDDHPQNHGFLFDGHRMVLSPAFDIVPVPWALCMDKDASLAMIAGKYGTSTSKKNILSSCEIFGLSKNDAEDMFNGIIEILNEKWLDLVEDCDLAQNDKEQLQPIFYHWSKSVVPEQ